MIQRRQTLIVLGIIALIAIVVIGGAVILSSTANNATSQLGVVASDKPIPANAEANARAWGPKDAPIKIEEFLDYQCPACGAYNRNFEGGVIDAFAKTGKVVTLADGKWLIIYGSRAVTNTQLDELGLTAAASIDVLTRPNGTHDGTILISEK